MIKLHKQHNKKIGIFGLGITGESVFRALDGIANIICFDDNQKNLEKIPQEFIVSLSDPRWQKLDLIVLSPGIPLKYPNPHLVVEIAKKNNIELSSDIDLLYEEYPDAIYIGITGTNGKSTTCALLYHMLKKSDDSFQLGGNIGIPCLDLLPPASKNDGFVLELSSFQLDLLQKLRLDVAAITNITPDHIDRHGSFEEYQKCKKGIFTRLKENGSGFYNIDDELIKKWNLDYYSCSASQENTDISLINHELIFHSLAKKIKLEENKSLQGAHNAQNITIAAGVANLFLDNFEDIKDGIKSFVGLPHRMEFIETKGNISFYNDSKATNIDSAIRSIGSLDKIYLLAGGISKQGDNLELLQEYSGKIMHLYSFGRDKELIKKACVEKITVTLCENMEEAFNMAISDAKKNISKCNILLAPACASLDQFKSFEERGREFIQMVRDAKV